MGSATPSQSGVDKHKGTAAGGRPSPAPSRGGGVRASEGTNPCTRPSFATKNVFDVLQDLSENIGGSPGPPWEPPSSFVPRYTRVWMDYLKKKSISLDVKDVLVHLVAAEAP